MTTLAMVLALLTTLPLAGTSAANAAGSWTEQTNSGSRNWYSIASTGDGSKLAAVVNGGSIWTSSDSGTTWTERAGAGTRDWVAIDIALGGTKLAAVAQYGGIYTSTDSGATWTEQTTAGSRNWRAITSNRGGTKLAAVDYGGSIWTSNDFGASWTERTSAGSKNWVSITSSGDGTKLAAVQFYGYIFTSADSGATWTYRSNAGSNSGYNQWKSVASSADGTKLAAVAFYDSHVYTSADSGANWTTQTGGTTGYWQSITSSSDGSVLAAAQSGDYVYLSDDSGVSFTAQTSTGTKTFTSIASNVDGSKLATTVNGGKIWTFTALGPAPTITSVSPSSGMLSAGTTLTITGTGFAEGAGVTVGGTACSNVSVVSATSITCDTPAGSEGQVDVVVKNADKQSATSRNAFTYVAGPTFTSVSPSSGPVAGGTRITITGTDFLSGDTVTFYGSSGLLGSCTSVTVVSSTTITCLTPAGSAGATDINIDDVYSQNALATEAFTYLGSKFSANAPTALSLRLESKTSTLQTMTVTNTGNTALKFGSHSVSKTGADAASFSLISDRCSRHSIAPGKTCTVGYKFYPSAVGNHTANLVFASNSPGGTNTVEITGVGLPKKISVVTVSRIKASSGSTSGGTSVTITGSGFNSSATVTIDGQTATITKRRGSTTIVVQTPAHAAGQVLVAVTNPDSGTAAYNGFTYVR
jgi:photosystem II stability/assembly factor-like uncharacterized protein